MLMTMTVDCGDPDDYCDDFGHNVDDDDCGQ